MPIKPDPDRLRELRGKHGMHLGHKIAKQEAREQAIADLRDAIDGLNPNGTDFDVDLRSTLRTIADLLEN